MRGELWRAMWQAMLIVIVVDSGTNVGVSLAADEDPRPNVLLIMTDDQGWGDFGFHGNPHVKTPHLDELARAKRRADAVPRLARVQSHAGQPDDRSLQLSHRRDRHVSGPLDDGRRRSDAGRNVCRGRISHRHLWQMAPGRQLSLRGRSTRDLPSRSCIAAEAWCSRPIRPGGSYFDPAAGSQRSRGEVARLLQRRVHRRRDRLCHAAEVRAVLCLPGIQLLRTRRCKCPRSI